MLNTGSTESAELSKSVKSFAVNCPPLHFTVLSENVPSCWSDWAVEGSSYFIATDFTRLTLPGRIIVGEARRMTHPATAEGIYQVMHSGMLAAQTLGKILKTRAAA